MSKIEPMALLLNVIIICLFPGCKKEEAPEHTANQASAWLINGRVNDENYIQGSVIAVMSDGSQIKNALSEDLSFSLTLPGNSLSAIHFLARSDETDNEDTSALLSFSEEQELGMRDTLRLPHPTTLSSLNLGTIRIKGEYAYPSINPALKLDFDQDGIPDANDRDDNNNGIFDVSEKDHALFVCHQQTTMTIDLSSLLQHQNHGDSLGHCTNNLADASMKNSHSKIR